MGRLRVSARGHNQPFANVRYRVVYRASTMAAVDNAGPGAYQETQREMQQLR